MSAELPSDPNPPGIYRPPENAPVPIPPGAAPTAPPQPTAPSAQPAPIMPLEHVGGAPVDPSLPVFPPPFVPRPPAPPPPVPASPAAMPAPPLAPLPPIGAEPAAPAAPPLPAVPPPSSLYSPPVASFPVPPAAPLYATPSAAPPLVAPAAAAATAVPVAVPSTPAAPAPPTVANVGATLKALPTKVKLAAAGCGVVGLAGLYLVAGVLVAGSEVKSQTQALNQTGADLTKIDAFLSDVSIRDAEKLDAKAFKAALDAYGTRLADTNATLTADQDRIDSVRGNIDSYGWLTPFESNQVHARDATIDHASAALAPVVKAVAIFRTQTNFYSVFISSEVHSDVAVAAAKKKDIATATTEFQQARNDLSQAQLMTRDSDVAPQFAPVVIGLGNQMRDIAGLTSAAQANDAIGVIQDLVQLEADLKTPVTFDQAAFRAWYSKKIDPLEIEFRKNAHQVPRYVVTRTQLV
jgi:hypothetical protein